MKFVMSDIHGCFPEFLKMLDLIEFKSEDTLYILGDVVDRGYYSIMTLEYIMNQPNIEMILGNHEELFLKSIINMDIGYHSCWMNNGGKNTYNQFLNRDKNVQQKILDYLNNLPLYKFINNNKYLLVHAGVNFDSLEAQDRETLLWARDEFINSIERFKDTIVIFGHTPTYYMQPEIKPMQIWKQHDGKIGIDCGACFNGGQLGCLRLDDMKEFYVEKI